MIIDWGGTGTGARFTFNLLWANSIRLKVAGNGLSGTCLGVWTTDGERLALPQQPAGLYVVRAESATSSAQLRFVQL